MEWVLQVMDEIDDALGALRLCSLGLSTEIGLMAAWIATSYRPLNVRRDSPTPL
jgi:hypothetical protein